MLFRSEREGEGRQGDEPERRYGVLRAARGLAAASKRVGGKGTLTSSIVTVVLPACLLSLAARRRDRGTEAYLAKLSRSFPRLTVPIS